MERKRCLLCGASVVGMVALISPTICCHTCCRNYDSSRYCLMKFGTKLSSKNVAKQMCGRESVHLNYKMFRGRGEFFLLAEVDTLAGLRAGEPGIMRQEHLALKRKKAELENELRYPLRLVDPVLRHFLLGDYLSRSFASDTQLSEVRWRCAVLTRVQTIRRDVPDAYPPAIFRFCLQFPDGGVEEYRDLVDKARSVMDVEGVRILRNLSDQERAQLRGTTLEGALRAFCRCNSLAHVRAYLERYVGRDSAQEIMLHQARECDAARTEETPAGNLAEFWNESNVCGSRIDGLKAFIEELLSIAVDTWNLDVEAFFHRPCDWRHFALRCLLELYEEVRRRRVVEHEIFFPCLVPLRRCLRLLLKDCWNNTEAGDLVMRIRFPLSRTWSIAKYPAM